jgi:Flp pilus assembly protein TadG
MTLRARRLAIAWGDAAGASAVEFAMVLVPFVMLIVGGFYGAGVVFAASSMQYAAEAAARCAAVQTTVCTDSTTTVAYANSHDLATSMGQPTFTYSTTGCGHVVHGTLTAELDTGISRIDVPLTATACFP